MTEEAARARRLVHGQVCYLQMLKPSTPPGPPRSTRPFFGWQTEHPYQDFESPGLIGQWVPGRPCRPPTAGLDDDLDPRRRPGAQTLEAVTKHGGEITRPPVPRLRTAPAPWPPSSTPKATLIGLASHTDS